MFTQMSDHETTDRFPILSIVIVNSDGLDDTLNCLESIYRHPPQENYEIILIDNCSKNPISDTVHNRYPQVRVYTAPQKQGFSKNYNMGIRLTQGEFVMILNNDTIVHCNALDNLMHAIRQNPSYGMVGPKLQSQNGQIQPVCARPLPTPGSFIRKQLYLDAGTPTGKLWLSLQQKKLSARASGPVPCINGACMLTSTAVLEQVGLLDESYDFYFEDVEWCHRVQKHGFAVAYIAEAEITHLGDQSLSKVREWAKKSEYLSALRYFGQYYHLSITQKWCLWLFTILSYLLRASYFSIEKFITKKENHAQAYWNLFEWIITQTPE
jgi:GT2 family glycosyltransferase